MDKSERYLYLSLVRLSARADDGDNPRSSLYRKECKAGMGNPYRRPTGTEARIARKCALAGVENLDPPALTDQAKASILRLKCLGEAVNPKRNLGGGGHFIMAPAPQTERSHLQMASSIETISVGQADQPRPSA
jgi:hypothetical protein